MVDIVTTFPPEDWERYAKKHVSLFLEHWPDANVMVYYEGEQQPELNAKGVSFKSLDMVPGFLGFREKNDVPHAHGRFAERYNLQYDAWKFAAKVYAQCDAFEREGLGYLVWLDADVEMTGKVPADYAEEMLMSYPMAIFQRPGFYTETGIVFWDREKTREFFVRYRRLFDDDLIFTIPNGWHDCWALDAVIQSLNLEVRDLTRRWTGKSEDLDVIATSELRGRFVHHKGQRKYAA